jgi:hypothetical protein
MDALRASIKGGQPSPAEKLTKAAKRPKSANHPPSAKRLAGDMRLRKRHWTEEDDSVYELQSLLLPPSIGRDLPLTESYGAEDSDGVDQSCG